jgi:hypothetical protein
MNLFFKGSGKTYFMGTISGSKYGVLPQIGVFIIEHKNKDDTFIINISEMRGKTQGMNERSGKIETTQEFQSFCNEQLAKRSTSDNGKYLKTN